MEDDVALINAHVAAAVPGVSKAPAEELKHCYLVPGGFYSQLWDWDAIFMGCGLIGQPGGAEHLAGSCMNFFERTSSGGEVPGCLLPRGASTTLAHAKPVLIWGAYIAAKATASFARFQQYAPQMRALLEYWRRPPRFDAATGLYLWFDQMESGADDLVYSAVASKHTPGWTEAEHGYRLAAPDLQVRGEAAGGWWAACREPTGAAPTRPRRRRPLRPPATSPPAPPDVAARPVRPRRAAARPARRPPQVLMHRELRAFALFLRRWAEQAGVPPPAEVGELEEAARGAAAALQRLWLWKDEVAGDGYYAAYDVRARAPLDHRTYQLAWPLWEKGCAGSAAQVDATVHAVTARDLWTPFGVRSTSSDDARYSNVNIIVPYSNWRGPVWPVHTGVVIAYGLARCGRRDLALELGANIVRLLAADLRRTGGWHENYDSSTGLGLASPGFVSWTVCAASLLGNLRAGVDPFALE